MGKKVFIPATVAAVVIILAVVLIATIVIIVLDIRRAIKNRGRINKL